MMVLLHQLTELTDLTFCMGMDEALFDIYQPACPPEFKDLNCVRYFPF